MRSAITIKRVGAAGFTFFAIKGCIWLGLAAVVSLGLV